MKYGKYSYDRVDQTEYSFISLGKKVIIKSALFTPTKYENVLNLGFGDLMPDGTIDDAMDSNNGDLVFVIATVIEIVKTFIIENPKKAIFFIGSTPRRTKFYQRVIKTYYKEFATDFIIMAILLQEDRSYRMVRFDDQITANVFAFLIKRNI